MLSPSQDSKNMFQYRVSRDNIEAADSSPYSLSPVGNKSQKLLRSPRKVSVGVIRSICSLGKSEDSTLSELRLALK